MRNTIRRSADAVALLCAASLSRAQQQDPPPSLEDLQRQLLELQRTSNDQIEELRFQLESLEQQLAASAAGAPATRSANAFNPRITVFADFLGRLDDRAVFLDDDPANERIDDQFLLRETEIDLRAAVDPWADAVLIAAFESEVPGEFEAAVEEGYLTLKRLPIADSAPAGLKLQLGRFRTDFGRVNQIHRHDLPWIDAPPSLRAYLGEEGSMRDGLAGRFFLPSPSQTSTLEASVSVLDGTEAPIAPDAEASDLSLGGRLKWFADLAEGQTLEVGASGLSDGPDAELYALDATYQWKPFAAGEWRSFLVGGELFAANLDQAGQADDPVGGYAWTQYQFDKNVYLGLRYDQHEEVADSSQDTRTFGAYLSYYTTEFLRFRLGYDHAESDVAEKDDRDTLALQVTWVFGSHPVEPYWVNR